MVTLKKAIENVYTSWGESPSELKIGSIDDLGYAWCICFKYEDTPFISGPPMVDKKTGKVSIYFPPHHPDDHPVPVEVPEEYR